MNNSIAPMGGHCNLPPAFAAWANVHQFITYIRVPGDKPGKMDKLPCDPRTGKVASAHDPATWTDYETAYAAVVAGRGEGVGFVFTKNDDYWFFDGDHCLVDGQWTPTVQDVAGMLKGAAFEVSGGGEGMHIFGRGKVPEHACRNGALGLEFYTSGRFVALTFRGVGGDVGADLTDRMEGFVAKYFPPSLEKERWTLGWTDEPLEEWL